VVAELDYVTVGQAGSGDPLPVDPGAVGAPEVNDIGIAPPYKECGVPGGHSGIVEDGATVTVRPSPDDRFAGVELEGASIGIAKGHESGGLDCGTPAEASGHGGGAESDGMPG
jgi:hypothetical protein